MKVKDIITDGNINFDDTHPQHDELMEQFVEHSVTVLVFTNVMNLLSGLDGQPERFVPFQRTFHEYPRAFEETSSCFQSQFESVDESK